MLDTCSRNPISPIQEKMTTPESWKKTSKYFDELVASDKTHYVKKLTLNNDKILPDPYSISEGWSTETANFPDVTYPDIYNYLIETPSEFTRDKMKVYKSLEAFNFFVSGHVDDVFVKDSGLKSFLFFKSNVLPSQRQGEKQEPYQTWIVTHEKGWILSANCTCMAG